MLYTEEVLEKLHKVTLTLLTEFDRICRKHDIPYIIEGGTLIGAVRHKGFIPWDDDADIKMLRKDYMRFCEVCKTELDHEHFFLQTYDTDAGYRWGYGKLVKKGTVYLRENQEMLTMKKGIFMDIFPCDNVPDNWVLHQLFTFQCFWARKNSYAPVGAKHSSSFVSRLLYKVIQKDSNEYIVKLYNKIANQYMKQDTKRVRIAGYGSRQEARGCYRRWMLEREEYEFEGLKLWGPRDYDGFLTYIHGDYMTLPPAEKRVANSPATYIAFEDGTEYSK